MDNRFTAIMVAAIVVVAVIAFVVGYYINKPEAPPAEEKIKIAFIFPGDVGDTSWNEAGYVAMNIFVGRHPDIEYTWIQGVYDPAQIRPQVEDYVTQGYNLIVGFGFQFEKPMYDVAQNLSEEQDVYFLIVAGPGSYKHPRLAVADVRTDQTGYICGYIMMQLTQTGHVGFVAGMDVAELHRSWIGQRKGIQDAGYNPDEVYHVAFVGDFHDVTKSSLLTYELIDTYGVDVLKTMGDGAQLGALPPPRPDTLRCSCRKHTIPKSTRTAWFSMRSGTGKSPTRSGTRTISLAGSAPRPDTCTGSSWRTTESRWRRGQSRGTSGTRSSTSKARSRPDK